MRTGASRLIRSVSPYTYSSATKSPTTTTSAREKAGSSAATGARSGSRLVGTRISYRAPRGASNVAVRVARLLPRGPRLPAAVEPVPAVRVEPDEALQPVVQVLHEGQGVALVVAGVGERERP